MRSTAVLLLGSLPLAAMTAWSIVELAAVRGPVTLDPADSQCEQTLAAAAKLRAELDVEGRAMDGLAEADLLDAEPLDGLDELPGSTRLKALEADWSRWRQAVETARAVAEAAQPVVPGDLDGLKQAASRVESVSSHLQGSTLPGRDEVLKAVARRLEELKSRIARLDREREAAGRVARAEAAFQAGQFAACATACGEALASYADAMPPDAVEAVRRLRDRAQLREDADRATAELAKTPAPAQRRQVLRRLLEKYPDRARLGDAEREVLDRFEREDQSAEALMEAADKDRAAGEALARLKANLPAGFAERANRAAEILDRYPTATVRAAVRGEALAWVAEFLPLVELQEPPQMQEVETARREIVRGFFTEVNAPRGYKCYPTHEQAMNPVADVGTYLAKELLGGPASTVPRRCVTRYQKARETLLASPGSKESWRQLADLCGQLETELQAYRRKPGSSREALSFAAPASFVRSQLEAAHWGNLEKLFGPAP